MYLQEGETSKRTIVLSELILWQFWIGLLLIPSYSATLPHSTTTAGYSNFFWVGKHPHHLHSPPVIIFLIISTRQWDGPMMPRFLRRRGAAARASKASTITKYTPQIWQSSRYQMPRHHPLHHPPHYIKISFLALPKR